MLCRQSVIGTGVWTASIIQEVKFAAFVKVASNIATVPARIKEKRETLQSCRKEKR
jgi:hypothetical protein